MGDGYVATSARTPASDGVHPTVTHSLLVAREMLETNFEKQVIKHHIKNTV